MIHLPCAYAVGWNTPFREGLLFWSYNGLLVHSIQGVVPQRVPIRTSSVSETSLPAQHAMATVSTAVSHAEVRRSPERHQGGLRRCREQPRAHDRCCSAPENTLARKTSSIKQKLKIVVTNDANIFLRAGTAHRGLARTETGRCGLTKQAGAALAVVGRTEEVPAVTTVCCNSNT